MFVCACACACAACRESASSPGGLAPRQEQREAVEREGLPSADAHFLSRWPHRGTARLRPGRGRESGPHTHVCATILPPVCGTAPSPQEPHVPHVWKGDTATTEGDSPHEAWRGGKEQVRALRPKGLHTGERSRGSCAVCTLLCIVDATCGTADGPLLCLRGAEDMGRGRKAGGLAVCRC